MVTKKDIRPLIEQLIHCNTTKTELESLKIWFLEFLGSIESVENIESKLVQTNNLSSYFFSFRYEGIVFQAQTVPPCRISIQTLGLLHYLNANGDYLSNVLALSSAIARELRVSMHKS